MFRDKNDVWKKLSELWISQDVQELETKGVKYAILSDIHLGNGESADDFAKNEPALQKALEHYWENGYKLILLGDIEELWQFDLSVIEAHYQNSVYKSLQRFSPDRVMRVFGNHDNEWGGLVDPIGGVNLSNNAPEALRLKDDKGIVRILLVHGHQGTVESDKYSWFSRFWVRIFSFVEPLARSTQLYSNPTATKSQIAKDYERTLYQWAKDHKAMVICGHTHRAIFASKSYAEQASKEKAELEAQNAKGIISPSKRFANIRKIDELTRILEDEKSKGRIIEAIDPDQEPLPCYFNTGCGVYSDGLTALEICEDQIRLVKWSRHSIPDGKDYECYQEDKFSKLIQKIDPVIRKKR